MKHQNNDRPTKSKTRVNEQINRSKNKSVRSAEAKRNSSFVDPAALNNALESLSIKLNEHWIYDIAELFTDCAVAIHRISKLVDEFKKQPAHIRDIKKLMAVLNEFANFEKLWCEQERCYLGEDVACPDAIEDFLDRIQTAGVTASKKAALKRKNSEEDFWRSFETVQQIRSQANN